MGKVNNTQELLAFFQPTLAAKITLTKFLATGS